MVYKFSCEYIKCFNLRQCEHTTMIYFLFFHLKHNKNQIRFTSVIIVMLQLTKMGFKVFDALDPSSGMLEKARAKGLYRNYICEAIGSKPLNIPSGTCNKLTLFKNIIQNSKTDRKCLKH